MVREGFVSLSPFSLPGYQRFEGQAQVRDLDQTWGKQRRAEECLHPQASWEGVESCFKFSRSVFPARSPQSFLLSARAALWV